MDDQISYAITKSISFSYPLILPILIELLIFLNIETRLPNSTTDKCETHLCFEFISHAIYSILYPYSCKTHNISSKLGFVGFLMKSK